MQTNTRTDQNKAQERRCESDVTTLNMETKPRAKQRETHMPNTKKNGRIFLVFATFLFAFAAMRNLRRRVFKYLNLCLHAGTAGDNCIINNANIDSTVGGGMLLPSAGAGNLHLFSILSLRARAARKCVVTHFKSDTLCKLGVHSILARCKLAALVLPRE